MAQFDVFKNPRGGAYPLLVDVQEELLQSLPTRVVVPLVVAAKYRAPLTRLNPAVRIRGVAYLMLFQELAAVPRDALGEPVESLAHRRADLIAALDLLFAGI